MISTSKFLNPDPDLVSALYLKFAEYCSDEMADMLTVATINRARSYRLRFASNKGYSLLSTKGKKLALSLTIGIAYSEVKKEYLQARAIMARLQG